ncbi:hypothetical protein [Streptomyces sp. NPDC018833]
MSDKIAGHSSRQLVAALGVTYGDFMLTGLNGLAVTTAPRTSPARSPD